MSLAKHIGTMSSASNIAAGSNKFASSFLQPCSGVRVASGAEPFREGRLTTPVRPTIFERRAVRGPGPPLGGEQAAGG